MFYIVTAFSLLSFTYITYSLSPFVSVDKAYLSLTTFLFSIFNGFFISRQASRYNEIRSLVSKIDANFSVIYRESTHVSPLFLRNIGKIILAYYETRKKGWDDYLRHKVTTITDLHKVIDKEYRKNSEQLHGEAMKRILVTLDDLQVQRKALVVLNEERVTKYQYAIVIMLALALVTSFLSIDSSYNIMESLIKAILVTTVGVVVWTLHQFDELRIFEGNVGEHTAQDIIDIIKGKK